MGGSGQALNYGGWWRPVTEPTVGSTRGERLRLLVVAPRLCSRPQHIVVTAMLFSNKLGLVAEGLSG